jgi:hypothetical protein
MMKLTHTLEIINQMQKECAKLKEFSERDK